MERLSDPRVYQCALQQSVEPFDWIADPSPFTHCPKVADIMKPETEQPFSSLDKCYARRNVVCKCGSTSPSNCKC